MSGKRTLGIISDGQLTFLTIVASFGFDEALAIALDGDEVASVGVDIDSVPSVREDKG